MTWDQFLSSGIDALDRQLFGGYPAGSIVLLVGSPVSGLELIAKQFCQNDSDAVYLMMGNETEEGMIDGRAMDVDECLAACTGMRNVVDSVTTLSDRCGREETLRFLHHVREHLKTSGGVLIGTLYPGVLLPLTEALVIRSADIVIECSVVDHADIISRTCVVRKKIGAVQDQILQYVVKEHGIEMVPTERVA
jgi:archaellum biogenesis ATPase FlaH